MSTISTINVPFHGNNLYVVNYNGEPYVPMRPIVEGMGLAWGAQFAKLKQRFSSSVSEIEMVAEDGKLRSMVCIALRKLSGWLHTISPNKVKPEIRDKVIQYQEECDDVLYEYWTTGEVKAKANARQSTAKELTPLRQTAERLIATGVGNIYPDIWKYVHKEFGVDHINELLPEQIPQAISFLDALEGEYIPKQQLPQVGLESLAMPMSFFDDFDWLFEEENISKNEALSHADAYPRCMLKTAPEYPNPVGVLLNKLQSAGVDVSAAQIQLRALRNHLRATIMQLDIASRKDTKTLLSNTNVAFNHLKAIREEWRTTLAPAIEKLNPNLEYEVTRRLAEMNGVIYANLMSLQGTKSAKLLA
ncbi:phage antirepressor N-terminal domain-containing protein [Providencia rettgeri]|nr:phage antirepressor N-terminal domain-containing protein [Providencia rettgeri]EIJ7165473.1 phage antirepressor N-terminal domain-containing protein [Providencia rettgeri]